MPSLLQRYFAQQDVINVIQQQASASPVALLAVSKTRPADDVATLYKAGHRDFGENYLQDALEKQRALAHLDIAWHFIGPIQSNKTRDIARYFSWVHSVDRLKVTRRLSEQRPSHLPPLNICLQVNVDEEETKAGLMLDELRDKIEPILALENIRLRGLMAIPKAGKTVAEQRQSFKKVADALVEINQQFDLALDTLSMGMSGDLEAAISEGATMVRVGTAIFGVRATKSKV
ncbi:MAG: YggS family pyridoxal phosphate-dependent enzyme [Cycloclasticus sp.]